MGGSRLFGLGLAALGFLAAGCSGRLMQHGTYPYGQPQYVTAPGGIPGPVASPPIYSPTPISNPTPAPTMPPPTATPIDGGGLSLTPAARTSAWYAPRIQNWGAPSTFAPTVIGPPVGQYAGLGRTFDGRAVSWNAGSVQAARPIKHRSRAGSVGPSLRQSQILDGMSPTPQEDLKYRGGKTIRDLTYINIYMGGKPAWSESDRKNIDWALNGAMTDPELNHVLMQYFDDQAISASYKGSFILDGFNPPRVTQGNIREIVRLLHERGSFSHLPLESTAICFYLPKGTILEDPDSGGSSAPVAPGDQSSSLMGLGGYHGSVHLGQQTLYYAVGVYPERLPNGQTNGIPVFQVPWKDTVATFYHQLQEIRTDPDVDDAIVTGQERYVGWASDSGEEVADFPVQADGNDGRLDEVFAEVRLANGSGTVPVQLCYSNVVHGPEGPIRKPHRGSPLPIPPASPPPSSVPSNPPSQPSPPPVTGGADPYFDMIEREWAHLPDAVKQRILQLVQDAVPEESEDHSFGQ